jgi:AraC family transcriptional regulator, alkane utilization regulator
MDPLSLIIDDMRFDGVVFVGTVLHAPWCLRLHTPGLAAFHVVTQGQAWLHRDGLEPVHVQTGDLVVLPAGQAHHIADSASLVPPGSPNGTRPTAEDLGPHLAPGLWAQRVLPGEGPATTLVSGHARFDVHMAAPLVQALPPLMHIRGMGEAPPLWLAIGLQFIQQETATARPGQQAILNRLGDILFMECLRDHVSALPERSGNWLSALKDRALSAALASMHQNPAHNWSVPELAQQACLSRSAFAERFGQVLGEPPLTYLTRHRMRLAARHLVSSTLPVSRVATQVGYASEAAFSQAFKREYGLSPSAWRQQKAKAQSEPQPRA